MKFVNELSEGQRVESVYAVADKQIRKTKQGKTFLSLRLTDKTGTVEAVVWDNADEYSAAFEKGDFIGVRADVGSYNGSNQLTVSRLKKVDPMPEYMARIMPTTDRDVEAMATELAGFAAEIQTPAIRELMEGLFGDEAFMEAFKTAPAAKGMHHCFSGGLIQHSLKVARLCRIIYDEYAENDPEIAELISRDILIAGAIMHDMGKVEELTQGPVFDYTLKGRLLGHISLGLMSLRERLDKVDGMPEDAAELLMHMILSHHGEYEYGSPKRPKCFEAFILHYADNLDAKIQGLAEFAGKDTVEGKFTAFNRLYERQFYKGTPPGQTTDGQPQPSDTSGPDCEAGSGSLPGSLPESN
ncbi:MAG TPA: HD domain-containing protein [Nitrospirota bacterium]